MECGDPFRLLDVLSSHNGLPGCLDEPVEQLFESAVEQGRYRYASVRWLRAMKAAANRLKDRVDLENLPAET